ncbi:hypothetical protein HMPREF9946_02415 [Acetobacteraceae bacterium AT-5844]|nr:hypothetical protein HMPREF9946_02415 [Acetobacteraceae bacterium AT-5844]
MRRASPLSGLGRRFCGPAGPGAGAVAWRFIGAGPNVTGRDNAGVSSLPQMALTLWAWP